MGRRAFLTVVGTVVGTAAVATGAGLAWRMLGAARPEGGMADIRVWPKGPGRGGVAGGLLLSKADGKGTLPLRAGDLFKVEATLDRAAFVYLFWVNPDGKALGIYPWVHPKKPTAEDWGGRPGQETMVERTLKLPRTAGKGFKIEAGEAGMETLVLVGRDRPLELGDDEARRWFEGLPAQRPVQGPQSVAWFDNGKLVRDDPARTRAGFEETDIDDPVLRIQELLTERIGPHARFTSAVCFATNAEV